MLSTEHIDQKGKYYNLTTQIASEVIVMRKKSGLIIILLLIGSFIHCMVNADYAFADRESQPKVTEVSYSKANNNVSPVSFSKMLDTLATLREDFVNVLNHFNPERASQMEQKNELIRDLLKIINDLPRKTTAAP